MAKKKAEEIQEETAAVKRGTKDKFAAFLKAAQWDTPPASEMKTDERRQWLDSGSYTVNALVSGSIYGGFASDSIIALAGEKSAGKTYMSLSVVKLFLESNPTARVFYFDSEEAVKPFMLKQRGIPTDRFYLKECHTVEQFRARVVKIVKGMTDLDEQDRVPILIVLDSLGMTTTQKELEEADKEVDAKKDMTKAQLIKGAFRVLTLLCGQANIPVLVTAHCYEKIGAGGRPGMPPPKELGGGEGLKYAASTIIFISKKHDYNDLTKNVDGGILSCKLYKSRFTKEQMKVTTYLDFVHGMDKYAGLFDVAKVVGAVTKEGNGFRFPDGQFAYTKNVDDAPEKYFTKDNLDAIDAKVQAAFKYGGGAAIVTTPEDDEEAGE